MLALLGILSVTAYSQCATDEYLQELLQDEEVADNYQRYLDGLGHIEWTGEGKNKKASKVIPVVFHVIHEYGDENISKEQIEDALRILNEDFGRTNADTTDTRSIFKGVAADMDIEFRLARTRVVNGDTICTEGITRWYSYLTNGGDVDNQIKDMVRWNYQKYLNVWVIKEIRRNWNPPSFVAGFATLPWGTSASVDGVVIRADYLGSIEEGDPGSAGRVFTHEVGHWLGLYHTFQGGCIGGGDGVADTPPVDDASRGCPYGDNTCNEAGDLPDQIENYMDYSDGICQNMFSQGQKDWIQQETFDNGYRVSNYSTATRLETGVDQERSCGPIPDFHPNALQTIICASSGNVKFWNDSYNGEVESFRWEFEGGTPAVSTGSDPVVSYSTPGRYTVKLVVENAFGKDSLIREDYITVLPEIAVTKAPYAQTFENTNYLNEGWYLGTFDGDGWQRRTDVAASGSASLECHIDQSTETGERFELIFAPLDLSAHGTPINLNFKHAYARRLSSSTEALIIAVSEDCGESWRTIKGLTASNGLASKSGVDPGFEPVQASDWGHYSVDISNYAGSQNAIFRFEVVSRGGNSVFIDNINVAQFGLGEEPISPLSRFVVYPNPARSEVKISAAEGWSGAKLSIHDLYGSLLLQSNIQGQEATVSVSDLSSGIYVLSLEKDGTRTTQRLIVQ